MSNAPSCVPTSKVADNQGNHSIIRKFKKRIDSWLFSKKGEEFCSYFNLLNGPYRQYPVTVTWDKHHQKICVEERGRKRLFIADSSLFEMNGYESSTRVSTTTLAAVIEGANLSKVKLLKLEAEGAEPEILMGAEKYLPKIEYISADLGPERGFKQEPTAAPAINFLLARHFELVDVYCDRSIFLFRNCRLD